MDIYIYVFVVLLKQLVGGPTERLSHKQKMFNDINFSCRFYNYFKFECEYLNENVKVIVNFFNFNDD